MCGVGARGRLFGCRSCVLTHNPACQPEPLFASVQMEHFWVSMSLEGPLVKPEHMVYERTLCQLLDSIEQACCWPGIRGINLDGELFDLSDSPG